MPFKDFMVTLLWSLWWGRVFHWKGLLDDSRSCQVVKQCQESNILLNAPCPGGAVGPGGSCRLLLKRSGLENNRHMKPQTHLGRTCPCHTNITRDWREVSLPTACFCPATRDISLSTKQGAAQPPCSPPLLPGNLNLLWFGFVLNSLSAVFLFHCVLLVL